MSDFYQVSRADLEAINKAMNHMGDVLNGMDAVEEEDEAATEAGFKAIQAILASHPSNAAGQDAPKWRTRGGIPRYKEPAATVPPSIPAAVDFQIWKERNAKYIEPKDFWQWLEQAFNDGKSVPAPAAIDVRAVLNHAAELATACDPRTGDWLYDDNEKLADAIRNIEFQSPPQTGKEES